MFRHYFQQELQHLRELGAEFAASHPALAPLLGKAGTDPDVERLLEAVAFQTAKVHQRLDDDFPELIQDLIHIIWPHYLRPLPAATTVAFTPEYHLTDSVIVPAGSLLGSIDVDGTSCLFSTCSDVEIHPVSILEASCEQPSGKPPRVTIAMDTGAVKLKDWQGKRLRFFLSGEYAGAADMYYLLREKLKSITLKPLEGGEPLTLPGSCLKAAGFDDGVSLLNYPPHAFPGYRFIQEYFFLPEKFLYFDLHGFEQWYSRGAGSRFEVILEFTCLPVSPPPVSMEYFVLNATPAVNVFPYNAEPIILDHTQSWYLVRPASPEKDDCRVYSIEAVSGKPQGTARERTYIPLDLFSAEAGASPVYHARYRPSPAGAGQDVYLAFSGDSHAGIFAEEIISVSLKCTNSMLPESLRTGDICVNTGSVPPFLNFRNIKPVTPSLPPPCGSNFLWRLISMLSLNYLSLSKAENFRALLEFHIFPDCRNQPAALANRRRISAIQGIEDRPAERLLRGTPVRGREITLQVHPDHFLSTGDMYLFGSVLENFLGGYASINSFTQLIIRDSLSGEAYRWPARLGRHYLI